METNDNINNSDNADIDLKEFFQVLWSGKWIVVAVTTLFIIAAVIYSLSLPNIYHSRAILSPVGESGGGMSQAMKNMGGLASLAGVSLSTGESSSKTFKAIEKLNTLSFFENNILPNIFLPDLMAFQSWSGETNNIYDKDIYNDATQTWTRDYSYPETQIPSSQESFDVFGGDHLQVFRDVDTGFVYITIKHQSPYVAKAWTELIVNQINYFFRAKSKLETQAAMDYLNVQMAQTSFSEIKSVIAQLLQQKMQQFTLIEASNFYVFDYIDPPAVMENKSEPSRSVICIIGAIIGGLLGSLIVVVRFYSKHKKLQ